MIFVAVYRVNKNRGYTVMANFHLRDKSLSLKAVGLLSKMLSFNDGWKFSTKGLSTICKEGPDAILSALRELEKHGYLVRHRQRDGKGRMSSTIFEIYEEPQESTPEREMPHTGNPCVEKPDVDNPRGDKSAQISTDQVITQERNTLSKNYQSINLDGMDRMDERSEYEEIIKENLDYNILCQDPKFDKDRFREIMDIMLDAVCSTAPTIRINGENMPQQVVKSRFLKLNSSHIEYVLEAMNKNPSDIRNIRAYLLTALYVGSFYDAEEVNALFEAAKGTKLELPILFGAFYGLRRSEAIGLKWDAIDFEQNTITIRHTVTSCDLDGKRILVASDTTKTKSSMRTLPLVPFMRERLLALKEEQQENRRLCGRSYIKDYLEYVCVNEIGDLIKPHYVTESFPKLLKAKGMRQIRYHDLRHSCASLLLANGVPMKQIQEWLGHSDFSTTANIYAHLDYSSKLTSADAMLNGLGLVPN